MAFIRQELGTRAFFGGKIETVELEIDIQNAPRGFVKLDIPVKVLDGRGDLVIELWELCHFKRGQA